VLFRSPSQQMYPAQVAVPAQSRGRPLGPSGGGSYPSASNGPAPRHHSAHSNNSSGGGSNCSSGANSRSDSLTRPEDAALLDGAPPSAGWDPAWRAADGYAMAAAQGTYGGGPVGLHNSGRALSAEDRRREERNRREQSRSNKIAQQIETLRDLLYSANYDGQFGKSATNKHNVLAATADYIRQLKEHNQEARAALNAPLPALAPPPPPPTSGEGNSPGASATEAASSSSTTAAAPESAEQTRSPGPSSSKQQQEQQRMPAVVVEQSETDSQTSNSDSRPDSTARKAPLATKSSKEVLNDGDYNQVFATSAVSRHSFIMGMYFFLCVNDLQLNHVLKALHCFHAPTLSLLILTVWIIYHSRRFSCPP